MGQNDELVLKINRAHERAQNLYGADSDYASFVKSILDTYINQVDRLENLKFQEVAHSKLTGTPSNVVFLNSHRRPSLNTSDLPAPKKSALNFPFVIEAMTAEDAFRMAISIHEISGRYAFLEFKSLDASTFVSKETFESLGPLTIYISDIESILLPMQAQLAQCLSARETARVPQVILGTNKSLNTLRSSKNVDQDLLNRITVGYLHMDQPFSFYKMGTYFDFLRSH